MANEQCSYFNFKISVFPIHQTRHLIFGNNLKLMIKPFKWQSKKCKKLNSITITIKIIMVCVENVWRRPILCVHVHVIISLRQFFTFFVFTVASVMSDSLWCNGM